MDRFLDDNRIKAILLEENSSEEEAFQMLISDAIIEEIVRYTNIHIANVQSKYQTERQRKMLQN